MIIGLSLLDQVGSFDISDSIVLTDAPESFLSQWTSTVARRAGDEVQLNGVEYVALANLGTGPTVQVSPALEEQNYNDPIRRVAHQAEWGEQRQWARTAVVNNLRLTDGRPGEAATRNQSLYAQFSLPQLITHLALLETVGSFVDNFFTRSEQLQLLTADLTQIFNNLGLELPQTKDGFRDLVRSLDLNDEAGRRTIAALLGVQEQFLKFIELAGTAGTVLGQLSDAFYTDAELLAQSALNLDLAFANIGVARPTSNQDFRALVESLDLNNDAEKKIFTQLLGVQEQFLSHSQLVDKEAAAARQAQESAIRAVEQALAPDVQAAQAAAESVSAIGSARGLALAPASFEGAVSQLDMFRRASAIQLEESKAYARRSQSQARASSRYASRAARSAGDAAASQVRANTADAQATLYMTALVTGLSDTQAALYEAAKGAEEGSTAVLTYAASLTQSQKTVYEHANAAEELAKKHQEEAAASRRASEASRRAARAAADAARRYANLARATKELSDFLFAVRHLGIQLDLTHKDAVRFGKELIKLGGGFETLQPQIESYYTNFFTEQERLSNLQADLALDFQHLGIAMPSTIRGFRNLVESQDLMTKEGRELWAALISIADAFATAKNEATRLAEAEKERQAEQRRAVEGNELSLIQSFEGEAAAIEEQIRRISERFSDLGRKIPSVDAAFREFSRKIFEIFSPDSRFLRDLPDFALKEINEYLEEITTLPTPEGLRELINALDLTTDRGREFHGILSEMALELKGLTDRSEQLNEQLSRQLRSNELSYLREFVSPRAEVNELLKDLAQDFTDLGLSLPSTRAQFVKLVESIDPTTESGASLIARLYELSIGFNSVHSSFLLVIAYQVVMADWPLITNMAPLYVDAVLSVAR